MHDMLTSTHYARNETFRDFIISPKQVNDLPL